MDMVGDGSTRPSYRFPSGVIFRGVAADSARILINVARVHLSGIIGGIEGVLMINISFSRLPLLPSCLRIAKRLVPRSTKGIVRIVHIRRHGSFLRTGL